MANSSRPVAQLQALTPTDLRMRADHLEHAADRAFWTGRHAEADRLWAEADRLADQAVRMEEQTKRAHSPGGPHP